MEAVLTCLAALPDAKLVFASRELFSTLDPTVKVAAILRSALLGIASTLTHDQLGGWQHVLDKVVTDHPFTVQRDVCSQPWLQSAKAWCSEKVPLKEGSHLNVPVVLLRFTHDSIDSRLHFRNQLSIFKTFDEFQRGVKTPQQLEEPLDVCVHEGKLFSLSNRRLFTLLMYQAVNRDREVLAPCIMRSKTWSQGKFNEAFTTQNDGLGIRAHSWGRVQEALHCSRPLFDSGRSTLQVLEELLVGSEYEWILQHVRLRESTKQDGAHSLTLSHGDDALSHFKERARSQPQPRQSPRLLDRDSTTSSLGELAKSVQKSVPVFPDGRRFTIGSNHRSKVSSFLADLDKSIVRGQEICLECDATFRWNRSKRLQKGFTCVPYACSICCASPDSWTPATEYFNNGNHGIYEIKHPGCDSVTEANSHTKSDVFCKKCCCLIMVPIEYQPGLFCHGLLFEGSFQMKSSSRPPLLIRPKM
eukprot:TRINITY_DN42129_c0_g1_i1.p1 TRINITY_DN42129_c0_g1~~TRINITY_DN42129_c0_g1_i1.p1  ORF type:complete len:493 (-),score=26.26 TRINITY_DN42129_c0_g1_i1:47-1462(-)